MGLYWKIAWVVWIGCLLAASVAAQQRLEGEGLQTWTVRQPYADNPLQQALLAGHMQFANDKRDAELQLECRKPEAARINVLFPSVGLAFDLDPFEGPPGIGQKEKLMEITVDQSPPKNYNFSGYYAESDRFAFSLALPAADMTRLVSNATTKEPLRIRISPANGKGSPLEFSFRLPSDNGPARAMVDPCLKSSGAHTHRQ
jgi:hypothetical protein